MLKPLHDSVILKKEEVEQTTKSGIILSTTKKEESDYATVIAVGEGRYENDKLIKPVVKPGQKVVYKKYSTTDIKIDDQEYLIISENDILAIVE